MSRKIIRLAFTFLVGAILLSSATFVNAADGSLDSSFEPGAGTNDRVVRAMAIQADGKVIIGLQFTSNDGPSRNHIARLNADGSLDTSFSPGTGANSTVYAIAIQPDGKVIIGGEFFAYDGTARSSIARLNSDGSLDTSFYPGSGTNSTVWTTAIQPDGKILIGGFFSAYNGTSRNRIARLNADGSLDSSFDPGTGASSPVLTTAIQPNGKVIISGAFTAYNGTSRNTIARLNLDGSLDTSFDPGAGASNVVMTTALQADGKIVIGGDFTSFNNTPRINIARLNADGSLDTFFNPEPSANSSVYTTAIQPDGKVIIGGSFSSFNGTSRNTIARLNPDGSLDNSFEPGTGTNYFVWTTAIQQDGKIIIGGGFNNFNGTPRDSIARLLVFDNDPGASGLVSRWRAEGDPLDSAGTNNGTLLNGTAFTAGVSGQAFSFDGTDDRVLVPNSPSLNVGTGDFTVTFFAKFNDLENNGNGLIHKDTYGNENLYRGWLFNICDNCAGSSGIGIETRNIEQGTDNNARYPTANFQAGRWYHIAAVRESNVLYLYIDGVLRATVAESTPTDLSNSADLEFGSLSSGSRQNLAGGLDEVNLFNRALSASDVLALSNVASDSTPPMIAPTISGTAGSDGWYVGDVEVSWSITDGESVVSSSTGCDTASVTADTAGVTFTCTATSGGGSSTQLVTVKRDATAPVVACGSADGAWHSSNVSLVCTGSDNISQLATASDASFSLTTIVGSGTETANAATGSRDVCDNAGNCTTAGPVSGNKVDKKAPTITIAVPTNSVYLLNQAVAASFTCQDGGSGVANCNGSAPNGSNIDTFSVGAKTFTVSSADNAGNAAVPQSVSYTVSFGISVLYDQTKAAKSGGTIPIKIQLVDALGHNVSSPAVFVHAVSLVQIATSAAETINDAGSANPDNNFRFDLSSGGSGSYIFNLKTTGLPTGTYRLGFMIDGDPAIHKVQFAVRQ